ISPSASLNRHALLVAGEIRESAARPRFGAKALPSETGTIAAQPPRQTQSRHLAEGTHSYPSVEKGVFPGESTPPGRLRSATLRTMSLWRGILR
ncbi:hypothetical protein, partial [Pantoea ananatis]|uniref:hypothetical protein n=1 Tax=Pantoea ananas TaxID=553 RepID=UPI001B31674A